MRLSSEIKIGIIITIAIAVTIWGLNFLKGRNILRSSDRFYTVYENIEGLEKNCKIFISGYRVGQVGDITFNSDGSNSLRVALDVEKKFRIPDGSVAVLYDADFMGTKAVRILPGESAEMLGEGDFLESRTEPGIMGRLEEQLVPVADRAASLIETIDTLISSMSYVFDRENADNLKSSIGQFKNSMDGVELMLAEDGKLNELMDNMNSITANLKEHNRELSAAMKNIESISDSIAKSDLRSAIDRANRTLTQTAEIMEKINAGEGSIGMMVNDDSLYLNIVGLSRELELLLEDLQANPKKYVNVSVFGGSDKKKKK